MINFRTPILGIDDTVSNPVRVSILKEIQRTLSIKESSRVIATQEIDELVRKEWNLRESVKDSEFQEDIIKVSSEETAVAESYFKSPSTNSYPKIFKDRDVVLRPVYINTRMSVTIEIESKSKSYISAIKEKLRMLLLSNASVSVHNILYRYHIPPKAYLLIAASYKHNNNFGLADNFEKYLFEHSDDRLSRSSTQGGKDHVVSVLYKEEQAVQGVFEFDLNAKVETKDLYYKFSFQYNLDFLKPTYIDVFYDMVIANQQLPDSLLLSRVTLNKAPSRQIEDIFTEFRTDEWFLSNIFSVYNRGYIRIPYIDNHSAIVRSSSEVILLSVLINISPADKRSLFNLTDLPDVALTDEIIAFMKCQHQYLTTPEESLFNLYIYSGSSYRFDIPLKVDSELNVYSDIELDLKETYRVYLVINTNRQLLTVNARGRINDCLSSLGITNQILLSLDNTKYLNYLSNLRPFNRSDQETLFLELVGQVGIESALMRIGRSGQADVIASGLAERNNALWLLLDRPADRRNDNVFRKTIQTSFIVAHLKEN